MAIQFLPILKALAPILVNAGAAAASFAGIRGSASALKSEERMRIIEEELARVGEVSANLAEVTQAIAEELRTQAAVNLALEKKMKRCLLLSAIAVCLGAAGLIVAFVR